MSSLSQRRQQIQVKNMWLQTCSFSYKWEKNHVKFPILFFKTMILYTGPFRTKPYILHSIQKLFYHKLHINQLTEWLTGYLLALWTYELHTKSNEMRWSWTTSTEWFGSSHYLFQSIIQNLCKDSHFPGRNPNYMCYE